MIKHTRVSTSPRMSLADDIPRSSPPPYGFEKERPFDIVKAVALVRRRLRIFNLRTHLACSRLAENRVFSVG